MTTTLLPLVNEGTTSYHTAVFKDKAGALAAPTSARYRVDSEADDVELLAWAAVVTPLATTEIEIDSTVNVMSDETLDEEVHIITVEGTYGLGSDKVTSRQRFTLVNMRSI